MVRSSEGCSKGIAPRRVKSWPDPGQRHTPSRGGGGCSWSSLASCLGEDRGPKTWGSGLGVVTDWPLSHLEKVTTSLAENGKNGNEGAPVNESTQMGRSGRGLKRHRHTSDFYNHFFS